MTYHSETLAHEELVEITGSSRYGGQVAWLNENEWKHHKSRAGAPIVGRLYARMRLAWITPQAATAQAWAPDFTGGRG